MKERSIKGKLRFIIIGVAFGLAIPVFLVSLLQMYRQKDTIEETNTASYGELSRETRARLEDMNRQVARDFSESYGERINQNFQQIRKNVEAVAAYMQVLYQYDNREGEMDPYLGIMPGADRESLRGEFLALKDIRNYINSLPDYDRQNLDPLDLYIATEKGMCLDGTDGSSYALSAPGEYADLRKTDWYKGAKAVSKKENSHYFWTSIFTGTQTGKDKINCAVPFFDAAGEFAGVAAGDITKEHIRETVLEINDEQLDYIILFNEENQVMLNPYGYEEVDSLVISDEILLKEEYMIAYTTLPENGWKLCLIFRQDSIQEALTYVEESINGNGKAVSVILADSIQKNSIMFFIVASVGALCALLIANVAAATFVKPIRQLMEQVKEVGAGNLDQRITVKSKDEIGRLGMCFDTMTKELKEYMKDVKSMTADKERAAAELDLARQIQKNMLPHHYPAYPGRKDMDIYGQTRMVREGGGDFYDFFLIQQRYFCILAGNASGSGILTTLMAVIARTHIKNYAQMGYQAGRILEEANNQLTRENETGFSVSAFLGIVDMTTGVMDCANAGAPIPLWKHSGGEFLPLSGKVCMALGTMENVPYTGQILTFVQGDLLCLHTEGVAKTADSRENQYTGEQFNQFLNEELKKKFVLKDIVDSVDSELHKFGEGMEQKQDRTMVLFRYFGE